MASTRETEQKRPYSSLEEEVISNLLRSCDAVNRAVQRSTRGYGITATQHNVLRILRSAQPEGLNCAAIGRRMIAAEPDITRLLSRLKALRLVRQHRDRQDRRVVWTHISDNGLELLEAMEPVVGDVPAQLLSHMTRQELTTLNQLLELARARCSAPGSQEEAPRRAPSSQERRPGSAVHAAAAASQVIAS